MANRVVIFPIGKQAEAAAYKAACDSHYAANFDPGGAFTYLRNDAEGQWVTSFYGPPWQHIEGQPFAEPPECAALRYDGVLHDFAIWPVEEELI